MAGSSPIHRLVLYSRARTPKRGQLVPRGDTRDVRRTGTSRENGCAVHSRAGVSVGLGGGRNAPSGTKRSALGGKER